MFINEKGRAFSQFADVLFQFLRADPDIHPIKPIYHIIPEHTMLVQKKLHLPLCQFL